DRPAELDRPGTSLRSWARELVAAAAAPERVAELATWVEALRDGAGREPLPLRRPVDPAVDTFGATRTVSWTLGAEHTAPLLTSVPAAFHAGINDVLLSTLAVALVAWRRDAGADVADVLLDVEGHGREPLGSGADLSRTVGWLTSVFPVRLDPALDPASGARRRVDGETLGRALKSVKEQLRALPDRGLGYGLLRHLNPRTAAVLAELPPPQICFNYLGRMPRPEPGAGADWAVAPGAQVLGGGADPGMPVAHPLEINAVVADGVAGPQLLVHCSWPRELLDERDVHGLAERWREALLGLVAHTATGAGGHTPSDLTLSSLTQDDIDELEQDLASDLDDDLDSEWGLLT
ncbi:condensation domain-containing protein, partial [Motilibacter deserti]